MGPRRGRSVCLGAAKQVGALAFVLGFSSLAGCEDTFLRPHEIVVMAEVETEAAFPAGVVPIEVDLDGDDDLDLYMPAERAGAAIHLGVLQLHENEEQTEREVELVELDYAFEPITVGEIGGRVLWVGRLDDGLALFDTTGALYAALPDLATPVVFLDQGPRSGGEGLVVGRDARDPTMLLRYVGPDLQRVEGPSLAGLVPDILLRVRGTRVAMIAAERGGAIASLSLEDGVGESIECGLGPLGVLAGANGVYAQCPAVGPGLLRFEAAPVGAGLIFIEHQHVPVHALPEGGPREIASFVVPRQDVTWQLAVAYAPAGGDALTMIFEDITPEGPSDLTRPIGGPLGQWDSPRSLADTDVVVVHDGKLTVLGDRMRYF